NNVIESGEFCDGTATNGECGAAFTCTNCNCACPSKVHFAGDPTDPKSILDTGWTGIAHRAPVISNGDVSISLSCSASTPPCGLGSVSAPIANCGTNQLKNRRCTNDLSIQCTSSAQCTGGTCEFFFGSVLPLAAGGVSTCVTNQFNGPVTGTANVETGDAVTS